MDDATQRTRQGRTQQAARGTHGSRGRHRRDTSDVGGAQLTVYPGRKRQQQLLHGSTRQCGTALIGTVAVAVAASTGMAASVHAGGVGRQDSTALQQRRQRHEQGLGLCCGGVASFTARHGVQGLQQRRRQLRHAHCSKPGQCFVLNRSLNHSSLATVASATSRARRGRGVLEVQATTLRATCCAVHGADSVIRW